MLLASCSREPQTEDTPIGGDEKDIRFTMSIPASGGTRSMSVNEEGRIDEIVVLAFYKDASNEWRYGYRAGNIRRADAAGVITVTAAVKGYSELQKFVVICNGASYIGGLIQHEKMADALRRIVCNEGNGEWPAYNNGSGTFKPIPMYAQTTEALVDAEGKMIGTFPLIRMVARVDVALKAGLANFELTGALLYNRKTSGYVPYDFSGFDGTNTTAAAVPATDGNPTGTPILAHATEYLAANSGAGVDPRGEILRSIYCYESPAYTEADRLKGTALIVGAKYNGVPGYYRINLKTTDDASSNASSHILRNHNYKVEIQSVSGPGYTTPAEAYQNAAQLMAVVKRYDLGAQGVIIDGQYNLTLTPERLDFGKEGGSARIEMSTNYDGKNSDNSTAAHPAGIFVDVTGVPAWLTVTTDGGAGLATQDGAMSRNITVTAAAYPAGGADRPAQFTVRAGNINYTVKVNQSKDSWLAVTAETYYYYEGFMQSVKVNSSYPWTVSIKSGTNDPDGGKKRITALLTQQGAAGASVPVNFAAYDNFAGKGTVADGAVTLVFSDPAGIRADVEKTVSLRSYVSQTFAVTGPAGNYAFTGGTQNYSVTSSAVRKKADGSTREVLIPWTAEFSTDGADWTAPQPDWLTAFTTSGPGGAATSYAASTVAFPSTTDNPEDLALRAAAAQGTSADPYDLSTQGGATSINTANCYVVNAPGYYKLPLVYGNAIKNGATNTSAYIPTTTGTYSLTAFVRHDNQPITGPYIYEQFTPADATPVWMDYPGLIDNVRLTDNQTLAFDVPQASIGQGNAIVAVLDTDNKILWSWHIWVTPTTIFNVAAPVTDVTENRTPPNTTFNFMRYNLGWCTARVTSFGTAPRSIRVRVGQAGAGATQSFTVTQNNHVITHGGNNPFWQWGRKDPMPPSNGLTDTDKTIYGPYSYIKSSLKINLGTTIGNPFTFYTESGWIRYDNLWSANKTASEINNTDLVVKTVYDPSPAGFVMPPSGAWSGFTTTGGNTGTRSEYNVSGPYNNGWNFHLAIDGTGPTVFYPASGIRKGESGLFERLGTNGFYATASPHGSGTGHLSFGPGEVFVYSTDGRNHASIVRCVAE